MTARIHSLLPQIAIVIGMLALVVVPITLYHRMRREYDVPRGTDVFRVVAGRWTTVGRTGSCDTNTTTLRFTPDNGDLILVRSRPVRSTDGGLDSVFRYPVVGHTLHSIQVVRRNETSLNADSTPVTWTLLLQSRDTYTWRRSDWLSLRPSPSYRRCPGS